MKKWLRYLLIGLAVLLAAALVIPLIIPIPPAGDTRPARELAGPNSEFVEVHGLEVHLQQSGEGTPPLILLHGFLASTFTWREVLDPLASDHLVIAFDRPAFGLTERQLPPYPNGVNPYTPSSQVELSIGLMDTFGVEQAVLVGNSAGGTIAMLTALEHPDRIAALVLVDPAVYTGGGAPPFVRPLLQLPQIRRIGPLFVRYVRNWGLELLEGAWHDPSRITPEIVAGSTLPLQADNWDRALWEFTLASREPDLVDRLDEFQMPVLVITGDDDRVVPTEQSIRLAGEIPGAKLVVIPECGHAPQEECPREFLQAAQDFLRGLNGREP
ncbi:MAG: alpha/beta hydrolase [Anaerolineales bacterium]|jgi:pimeloyl-ACP methyl ester carboxylesterase